MNKALSTDSKEESYSSQLIYAAKFVQLHCKIPIFAINFLMRVSFLQKIIVNVFNIPSKVFATYSISSASMHGVTPNVPEKYLAKIYPICEDELHQHIKQWKKQTNKKKEAYV